MDPNETLRQIRELRADLFANDEPYDPEIVRSLAERVDELDNWLTRGGFPPSAWRA